MTFEQWMTKVRIAMDRIAMVDPDDLTDWDYYDAYEDEMSPVEAARAALLDNGYYGAGQGVVE